MVFVDHYFSIINVNVLWSKNYCKTLTYVALDIIVLDILKYGFKIDLVQQESKQLDKQKVHVRPKRPIRIS